MRTFGWNWIFLIAVMNRAILVCEAFIRTLPITSTSISTSTLTPRSNFRGGVNQLLQLDPAANRLKLNRNLLNPMMMGNQDPQSNVNVKEGSYEALVSRPGLALLDLASLFLFAAIGKASHATDGSIDIVSICITAFPFVVSWFSVAPLLGSYDRLATQDAIGAFIYTARGWGLAIPLGCALRGAIKGYIPPTPFVVVTMISTLVILGGSRALYTIAKDKSSS